MEILKRMLNIQTPKIDRSGHMCYQCYMLDLLNVGIRLSEAHASILDKKRGVCIGCATLGQGFCDATNCPEKLAAEHGAGDESE